MQHHPQIQYELARQHHAELLREAENARLAALGGRVSPFAKIRRLVSRRPVEVAEPVMRPRVRPA